MPLYARHGVRETWVVDVGQRLVHVFRDPSPEGYGRHERREPGESIAPGAFPDVAIDVGEVVGTA